MVATEHDPEKTAGSEPDSAGTSAEETASRRGVVVPLKDEAYQVLPKFGVLHSFRAAFVGVARTVASQRNMKLHVLSALMVMIVGMALPLDLAMRVSLIFAVSAVFFAEILNTGLEALVDLFIGEYHRLAMLAKDAAAAGVLVIAVGALLVFAEVVWTRWDLVVDNLDAVWWSVAFGLPLVVVEAVGLFVIRRGALAILRLALSLSLLATLVVRSHDPIYSGFALLLVLVSAYARYHFPRHTGRGAPKAAP